MPFSMSAMAADAEDTDSTDKFTSGVQIFNSNPFSFSPKNQRFEERNGTSEQHEELEVVDESQQYGPDEDVINVYTAYPPPASETQASKPSPSVFIDDDIPDYMRDYSPTSESELEDIPAIKPKFYLESDISKSEIATKNTTMMDSPTALADFGHAVRCTKCIAQHRGCDRALPFCGRCTTPSECVYPNSRSGSRQRAESKTNSLELSERKAIDQIQPLNMRSNQENLIQSKLPPSMKDIVWKDGEESQSQRQCPRAIIELVARYLGDFTSKVIATPWPNQKGCFYDMGREVIYIDDQIPYPRDIPVARYLYGGTKQFFIAWLSGKDTSSSWAPHVVIYLNKGQTNAIVNYKERRWRTVYWKTWEPSKIHTQRTVLRLIEDKPPKTGTAALSGPKAASPKNSTSSTDLAVDGTPVEHGNDHDTIRLRLSVSEKAKRRTDDIEPIQDLAHNTKRQKPSDTGYMSLGLRRDRGTHGRFSTVQSQSSRAPINPQDLASGRSSCPPSRPKANYTTSDTKYCSNTVVVFEDGSGTPMGTYPFSECDNAQKLFDVACVSQIAQVEPPATRLLKVRFGDGTQGRIRPDNNDDFDSSISSPLGVLTKKGKNSTITIIVSPYL